MALVGSANSSCTLSNRISPGFVKVEQDSVTGNDASPFIFFLTTNLKLEIDLPLSFAATSLQIRNSIRFSFG